MNYRVTIEPLSDIAKENMKEPEILYLDGIVMAGSYDPAEVANKPMLQPTREIKPGMIGQANIVIGKGCVEALFQLIRYGLPDDIKLALASRMIKDRMGMIATKEVASATLEPLRGGSNG